MPVLSKEMIGEKKEVKCKKSSLKVNNGNVDITKITNKDYLLENYLNCSKLISFRVAYRQIVLLNEMLLSSEGYFQKLKKQSIMFGNEYLIDCCTKNADYIKQTYLDMFKYAVPDINKATSEFERYNNIFMLEALSIICNSEFRPQLYISKTAPQLNVVYAECLGKVGNVTNLVPVVVADNLHTLYMQCVGEVSLINVLYGKD